jgi:transcriptional regulator with XRE-family HTH domain
LKNARDAFGPRLQAARERAGVTLDAIAESTKIQRALFAGLESNDVSRWPNGIFRRAFLREYLAAIGVPAEPVVAEFVRLFPEDGAPAAIDAAEAAEGGGSELRLTLDKMPPSANPRLAWLAAAAIDATIVILISAAAWTLLSTGWLATAVVAFSYYSIGTLCFGVSAGVVLVAGSPRMPRHMPRVRPAKAREILHIVARRQSAASPAPQPFQAARDEEPAPLRAASR